VFKNVLHIFFNTPYPYFMQRDLIQHLLKESIYNSGGLSGRPNSHKYKELIMHRLPHRIIWLAALVAILIVSCTPQPGGKSGPALAIEAYLQAMISKNSNQIAALSCPDWEEQAQMEVDSFAAVTAKLDSLACQEVSNDGKTSTVKCTGKIITTYNNENQEISLDIRTYKAVQQNNEWQMCGYK
jgi:hypothetical protein